MTWDKAKERAEQAGQGGDFIRLSDDGDSFVGIFLGDPHIKDIIWNEKKEMYEDYNDDHKAAGKSPQAKFTINVYVTKAKIKGFELKEPALKIYDLSAKHFKDLLAVRDKYGLDKWSFEVKRSGKKGDSRTSYSVLPETNITDAEKTAIKALELHDLTKVKDEGSGTDDLSSHDKKKKETNGTATAGGAAPGPITSEQAQAIIMRLKAQTKDKIDAFLKKFGIAQVKLLKTADLPTALAMLDEYEGKNKAAAAAEEVDPFA